MSYNHLTIDEREIILLMHHDRENVTTIAKVLNRNKGTISRELRRNRGEHGYSAHEAQSSYRMRRATCRPGLKVLKREVHDHIVLGLENYWSPEQIIQYHGLPMCIETIYRALKRGLLPIILRENLRQHGIPRKAKGEEKRGSIPDCVSIEKRSPEASSRSRIGDWEGDTVAGKWRTGCFMTLVDRKTRFLVSRKLEDHKSQTLRESICSSLQGLPCMSLTVDNGKEFAAHKETSADLEAPIYFCHPHSPWERPTNENTNGLLRQFFPKFTSFLEVTQEHLDWAVDLLNNRPRKCLGWKTPFQAMSEGLLHLD